MQQQTDLIGHLDAQHTGLTDLFGHAIVPVKNGPGPAKPKDVNKPVHVLGAGVTAFIQDIFVGTDADPTTFRVSGKYEKLSQGEWDWLDEEDVFDKFVGWLHYRALHENLELLTSDDFKDEASEDIVDALRWVFSGYETAGTHHSRIPFSFLLCCKYNGVEPSELRSKLLQLERVRYLIQHLFSEEEAYLPPKNPVILYENLEHMLPVPDGEWESLIPGH